MTSNIQYMKNTTIQKLRSSFVSYFDELDYFNIMSDLTDNPDSDNDYLTDR